MPEPNPPNHPWLSLDNRKVKITLAGVLLLLAIPLAVTSYCYVKFARRIDRKLAAGPFADTVNLFAAPQTIAVGDAIGPDEIVSRLRRGGYGLSRENRTGWYNLRPGTVEIFPGRESYFDQEPAVIRFAGGKISGIVSLQDNTGRSQYRLEPRLIANLSDRHREKRRLVHFSEIPPALIHAVISAEDKHFFRHSGFDVLRILKAAYVDLREGRKEQGASTLSMQLTRGLWLDSDKRWARKAAELLMTLHLEEKLTKQQIFEIYANQVYLGRRGTFNINGFGEGARVFFGKDLGRLTVPEAATLAGMVQRPSYFNPLHYPERARNRRNVVLALMRQNGYLTDEEYRAGASSTLAVHDNSGDGVDSDAQYFLDLVNDELQDRFGDHERRTRSVYTTLDWSLQQAAEAAVRVGMQGVDQALRKKRFAAPPNQPQVALLALDPHTGAIKALVGGRNYTTSQLDHALARRQPGSAFKPFVYAAALDTAIEGGPRILTPASTVEDAPTTFAYDRQTYEPSNFRHQFLGTVTLRSALAHSLNVATVKVAQMVGYGRVVDMARRAGLDKARATPAVALGAYEQTPLEIAGAYTVFANEGVYVRPALVSMVRAPDGQVLYRGQPEQRRALDPRVAYLMVNMMQEVLRSGTGAGVRTRGFTLPAAGKTGTSRDGWFAGFTSDLLCVVWVGFDDNRELPLEGAKSALPIWTEFMKRAHQLREYRDAKDFRVPEGIVREAICPETGQLATPLCGEERTDVFIDGTQPVVECELHKLPQQYADRAGEPGLPQLVPLATPAASSALPPN